MVVRVLFMLFVGLSIVSFSDCSAILHWVFVRLLPCLCV